MGKGWNDFETHESKSLDCLEQNVGRAMHVLETALKEVLEPVTGNWKKGSPCYHNRKNLA